MKATRRSVIAGGVLGALAVPTVAGLASWRWRHGEGAALLFDPSLEAGRRFAEAGQAAGSDIRAIAGDPIRFAKGLLAERPALIVGISRQSDALLIGEAASEAGFARAVELGGSGKGCAGLHCDPAWAALSRFAVGAGGRWPEALATWASNPASGNLPHLPATRPAPGGEAALGWVLAPRA